MCNLRGFKKNVRAVPVCTLIDASLVIGCETYVFCLCNFQHTTFLNYRLDADMKSIKTGRLVARQ